MSPQFQTMPVQGQNPQVQGQQVQGQQAQSVQTAQAGYGRLTGTVDYGPNGKAHYENYCPLAIFTCGLAAVTRILAESERAGQTGIGLADGDDVTPHVVTIAHQIRQIASGLPKKWQDRKKLFALAAALVNLSPISATITSPAEMVPDGTQNQLQSDDEMNVSARNAPAVTPDQIQWAFNQISEGLSTFAQNNPSLRAAMNVLQLGMEGGVNTQGGRTAGRRQKGKKGRQPQYS
jgi:hypothetical protein